MLFRHGLRILAAATFLSCTQSIGDSPAPGRSARHSARARHVLTGPFLCEKPSSCQSAADGAARLDSTISLTEVRGTSTGEWTGHRIWPSAILALQHLHDTRGDGLVGLRVLELGCGLPLLSAGLAALGASVCATDRDRATSHVIDALAQSSGDGVAVGIIEGLSASARARVRVRPLDWGGLDAARNLSAHCDFEGPIDLIVGADLVYDGFPREPLRETLVAALLAEGATAFLGLQPRRFPMSAALKEPRLVAQFLRDLAVEGDGWDVSVHRPSDDAKAQFGDAAEGAVLATITPPGARERGRALADVLDVHGHRPMRYTREVLAIAEGRETQRSDL